MALCMRGSRLAYWLVEKAWTASGPTPEVARVAAAASNASSASEPASPPFTALCRRRGPTPGQLGRVDVNLGSNNSDRRGNVLGLGQ